MNSSELFQEITVAAVALCAVAWVVVRFVRTWRGKRKPGCGCDGCPLECASRGKKSSEKVCENKK